MDPVEISVVIPVYDEVNVLDELNDRLTNTLSGLSQNYEVIYVDDGSNDGSLEKLVAFHRNNSRIRIVSLSRNFGHQPSLVAGVEAASGKCVVLIDADLQDRPEAIKDFYYKWKEGHEVVYAIRAKRKAPFFKRVAVKIFYRILSRVSLISQPLDAGIFSLMDRKVIDVLRSLKERNRYITGLRSYIGFRQTGILVERDDRKDGKPRVGLRGLFQLAFDAIFSFSYLPLRLATFGGTVVAFLSFLTMAYFAILRILVYFGVVKVSILPGFTMIACATFLMGGIMLICIGIVGEYIGRIYDEVKNRPYFVINEKIGFKED